MSLHPRRRDHARLSSRSAARRIAQLVLLLLLAGCTPGAPLPEASVTPTSPLPAPTGEPTATSEETPEALPFQGGKRYRNSDLGVTLYYPSSWRPRPGENEG